MIATSSLLALIGIVIGVGSVIAMISIGVIVRDESLRSSRSWTRTFSSFASSPRRRESPPWSRRTMRSDSPRFRPSPRRLSIVHWRRNFNQSMRRIAAIHLIGAMLVTMSGAACEDVHKRTAAGHIHPSLRGANLAPLVSAKEFYLPVRESWGHIVSPDGERLAWIEPQNGTPTIHVRLLASGDTTIMNHPSAVTRVHWAADGRHLVFFRNGRLFAADTRFPQLRPQDLTPFPGAMLEWYGSPLSRPDVVLVRMNTNKRQVFDLYEINLRTGLHKRLQHNDGRPASWFYNETGDVTGRLTVAPDHGWYVQALGDGNGWKTVLAGNADEVISPVFPVPNHDSVFYVLTNVGHDKVVAIALDWKSGEQQILYERPDVDVTRMWVDPRYHRPVVVEYFDGLPRYHYFDAVLRKDMETILGPGPMVHEIRSASADFMRLTIRTWTDRSRVRNYLIDRRTGNKKLLSTLPLHKHEQGLSETRPIRFSARDGLPINGYLTTPHGTDGKHLPMVLKVHGGPWERDLWGFDPDTQFLANRGYAVLEVNFRGSRGFGKAFVERGCKEFGRKMQDDLMDAVEWAVAEGYADPKKIAVYGGSYGGYATLVAMTRTPERFAAGIDVNGISDLALFITSLPLNLKRTRARWLRCVGNPDHPNERKELIEHSPITHAHRVQRPLLIVHGARDPLVSKEHSDGLVKHLRENDVPVDYLVFPDEGHHIVKRENVLKFAHRLEAFLAEHLGGRVGSPD